MAPEQRIVVNLGMPRSGTRSWDAKMKRLHPNSTRGEFHHITPYSAYSSEDLAELLLLGNRSAPANPLFRYLTRPPAGGIRALSDVPWFLLAPVAGDFPRVHWVHVTRDPYAHADSTLRMLKNYCYRDRCRCAAAPRCTTGALALVDRLYFDKYGALGHLCRDLDVPRALVRAWLASWEEETVGYLRGHPRFLHLHTEDDARSSMQTLAHFLGLDFNASKLNSVDLKSFHIT